MSLSDILLDVLPTMYYLFNIHQYMLELFLLGGGWGYWVVLC